MKIVITGNYGAKNSGDELILEGLLSAIEEINPATEVTVLSGDPKETSKRHRINSDQKFPSGIRSWIKFNFFFEPKTKKHLSECDYFILGGGGLFGGLTISANIIWGVQALKAFSQKKKVVIYGQSLGNLDGWLNKRIVKHVFSKAHAIAVRDNQSKEKIIRMGICREVFVIPDLALRKKYTPKGIKEEKTLLVSLRELQAKGETVAKIVAHFINWLKGHEGWKIKIVDFQGGETGDIDKKIHEKLVNIVKDTENIEYLGYIKDSQELLETVEKATIILGMRLHSIIAATMTQTPFMALSYEPKVDGFLKESSLSTQGISIENLTVDKLKLLFKQTERDYENIKASEKSYCEKSLEQHRKIEKSTLRKFLQDD